MAKQKNEQQALATSGSAALATTQTDELAGLDFDISDDGLGELDREDFRVAALVLNFKGTDENGRAILPDVYYDTIDEVTLDHVNAVFLDLHKTNLWSEFDKTDGKMVIHCRSFDRITGTMSDGSTRPCSGCPDAEWITGEDGKRRRRCGPVYNVMGVNRDTSMAFVYRAKKTSLPVLKQYLQKHHVGRRIVEVKNPETGRTERRRANYPLFTFQVTMTAEMKTSGGTSWAVPVFSRGDRLERDEIEQHAATQQFLRKNLGAFFGQLEDIAESKGGAEGGDTSFDTSKFAGEGDQGRDFADGGAV